MPLDNFILSAHFVLFLIISLHFVPFLTEAFCPFIFTEVARAFFVEYECTILTLSFGSSHAELPGVILCDVAVPPDVEMLLLGEVHGVLVLLLELGELPASLPVHHEQTVLHEPHTDVVLGVR